MTDDCRHRDDAGPWVLGALGEPDAGAFALHLETCAECRREVADLQVVADVLPMAAPQLVPSPDLKSRIMATVTAEAELLAAAGPEADRVPSPDRERAVGGVFGWLRGLRPVGLAGLATGVLAVGVVLGVVIETGGGGTTTHKGFGPTGAQVALEVDSSNHGKIELQHMPAAPAGRVYQVWLVSGKSKPRPTHALFSVAKDGKATVEIPESLKGTDQVLVTAEPPGGSPQPTSSPLAGAKLT